MKSNVIEPGDLVDRDWLLGLLWKSTKGDWRKAFLLGVLMNGTLIIGAGSIISSMYCSLPNCVPIFYPAELFFAIFAYLFAGPVVWAFFVGEIRIEDMLYSGLLKNQILQEGEHRRAERYIRYVITVQKRSWRRSAITILGFCAFFALWVYKRTYLYDPFRFGVGTKWHEIVPVYFWAVWVPLSFLHLYMLLYLVTRRWDTFKIINKYLRSFRVSLVPMHVDRANGFGFIGRYAFSIWPILTDAGLWLYLAITIPMFTGERVNLSIDTIAFLVLYFCAIPITALLPLWKTHEVMIEAKEQLLSGIASQINTLIFRIGFAQKISREELSLLLELQKEYEQLDKVCVTWPFPVRDLGRFLFSTLLPFFGSVVSIALDVWGIFA